MIATTATLLYDFPQEIVAPTGIPEQPRPQFTYLIPPDANAATREHMGFAVHFAKLQALARDAALWPDQAEPPEEFAATWAQVVMQQLQSDDLLPTRVVASAEGGI